jgi:hypothetical protein
MPHFLLILFILISSTAFASPAEEPVESNVPILESIQGFLGGQFNYVANRMDAFFATERADDEFGRSRIRIRSQFLLRERAPSYLKNQYRLNLKLPHLEQKFKYNFADENEKNTKGNNKEKSEPTVKRNTDENKGWIFNADMGVSVAIPPKLVTRARARRNIVTGTFTHRFVEQLTYITDASGLVEETGLLSDHPYTERFLFRFVNTKQWQVLQKEFSTNHGPTWLHAITDDDAFNYSATMQTIIDDSVWYTSNYRLSVNYRRNVYKQWFYFDVIPGIDFPKVWSFRRTPFITFQLELLFGG